MMTVTTMMMMTMMVAMISSVAKVEVPHLLQHLAGRVLLPREEKVQPLAAKAKVQPLVVALVVVASAVVVQLAAPLV